MHHQCLAPIAVTDPLCWPTTKSPQVITLLGFRCREVLRGNNPVSPGFLLCGGRYLGALDPDEEDESELAWSLTETASESSQSVTCSADSVSEFASLDVALPMSSIGRLINGRRWLL
ncbi:hypothetical protein DPMN_079161 [Dreissena polymorpha]|uniref:Uncharacterized protein n=1 Tax=Dreissena polymorpha TaxID=45954 RepID=A0A9D3YQ97_DREPO|nr:hypothetical protein DPMN_079161 [Dreissena polymorpha]